MVKDHVDDTLSGGPRQGVRNQQNTDRGSNVGRSLYGGNPKSAGLDRGRNVRQGEDEAINREVDNGKKR